MLGGRGWLCGVVIDVKKYVSIDVTFVPTIFFLI